MTVDAVMLVAVALIVAAVSAIVFRSIGRRQLAESRAELAAELAVAKREAEWLQEELSRQSATLGSTRDLLDKTEQKLRDTFQSLAASALKESQSSFLTLAKASFERYQQPLEDTLKSVDRRLVEAERERLAAYTRLSEQVTALGAAANTLSRALRTPAVRGRWGEMQLRRVVEMAGMLRRCDFDEQPGIQTDNGRLRPDLIVHLPGGKQIVVDAKVPLEAYLDAQEAPDDATRASRLQAHARQVRDHMDKLSGKAYAEQLGNSPELVVMFLPGETLFSAALQQDLTLIEHGLEQRVLLASPITLIALLTTVAHSWRQEALTENYREVARLGKEFYERLAIFADRFDDVRKRLDGAVQAYNDAAGSFEARVLVSARRLKDLNVTAAGELPQVGSIDTVPRVLRQVGLMGLPEDASGDEPETTE
jgi:DNA recombination protein RmuC